MKFETVSDELRVSPRSVMRGPKLEIYKRLAAEETLFVELNGAAPNTVSVKLYDAAKRFGYKSHLRRSVFDGRDGYIVWWERKA